MTFDLITIGESLRDIFYLLDEASVSCSLQKDRCLLCLDFSEKIPVQHIVKVPAAGNSANVAVGASRLGLRTSLVTWIGNDHSGRHIKEALTDEGVDLRFLQIDNTHPTSEATVLVFKGERTQLVNFQPRIYRLQKLPSTTCIYYSAVGSTHDFLDRMLVQELKRHPETRFVFQPGTTHVRDGVEKIAQLLKKSFLFILNKDEAHRLLGDGNRPMRNLLESFYNYGAQAVIITDGANGADAYDGTTHWHMSAFPVVSIEPTGAGDSFATGVIVSLLCGDGLSQALRWGTANSWSVIQHIGPQKGLLTKTHLQRVLKKFKHIQPQRQS